MLDCLLLLLIIYSADLGGQGSLLFRWDFYNRVWLLHDDLLNPIGMFFFLAFIDHLYTLGYADFFDTLAAVIDVDSGDEDGSDAEDQTETDYDGGDSEGGDGDDGLEGFDCEKFVVSDVDTDFGEDDCDDSASSSDGRSGGSSDPDWTDDESTSDGSGDESDEDLCAVNKHCVVESDADRVYSDGLRRGSRLVPTRMRDGIICVSRLEPTKVGCRIFVKVLHVWLHETSTAPKTLEIILVDEQVLIYICYDIYAYVLDCVLY